MQQIKDQTHSRLPGELLALLQCTSCRSSLSESDDGFTCMKCGQKFPSVRGVFRFVDAHNYADSFGYQWHKFDKTQLDRDGDTFSERDFRRKVGLKPQDFEGQLILDVGCGMGRFAEVATRWGGRVVGIDLSTAAEMAAHNLADRDFVALQADVFQLPFRAESFDYIYSMGVLHHTPDCEQAFKILPQYLKPGGGIAIWLYSRYNKWYRFSDIYRRLTQRMPAPVLLGILRVAVPFFYWLDRGLRLIPLVGNPAAGIVHHIFPVNLKGNPERRLLDTFDWYSPKYQSKHTYEEVFRWFEDCGLKDLTVGQVSIGVRGRKPADANSRERY